MFTYFRVKKAINTTLAKTTMLKQDWLFIMLSGNIQQTQGYLYAEHKKSGKNIFLPAIPVFI
jgi:hypothetical protein